MLFLLTPASALSFTLWWISPGLTFPPFTHALHSSLALGSQWIHYFKTAKQEEKLFPQYFMLGLLCLPACISQKFCRKDSALGWATHHPLAPFLQPDFVGFWTTPRCHHGLHSWGQNPENLVAADKHSKMHGSQHSSEMPGHCFIGVHRAMMQKLLKLLDEDHSEESQKIKNSQFPPLLHWMTHRKRAPLSPMTTSNSCTE